MAGVYRCSGCGAHFRGSRRLCSFCGTPGVETDRETCRGCGMRLTDSTHQQCPVCGGTEIERIASSDGA